MIDVLTALDRSRKPTTTMKPWNRRRSSKGPARFIAIPATRLSAACGRSASGMMAKAKNDTSEVKTSE